MEIFKVVLLMALVANAHGVVATPYKDDPKSSDKEWLRSMLKDASKLAVQRLNEIREEKRGLHKSVIDMVEKRLSEYSAKTTAENIPASNDRPYLKSLLKEVADFAVRGLKDAKGQLDSMPSEVQDFAKRQLNHYTDSKRMQVSPSAMHSADKLDSNENDFANNYPRVYSYGESESSQAGMREVLKEETGPSAKFTSDTGSEGLAQGDLANLNEPSPRAVETAPADMSTTGYQPASEFSKDEPVPYKESQPLAPNKREFSDEDINDLLDYDMNRGKE